MEKRDFDNIERTVFAFMRVFLTFILLFSAILTKAQGIDNIDSLKKVLVSAKEDTNKVFLLIKIGQQVEYSNLEEAKQYYDKARILSERLNYPFGIHKYIANYTAVLNAQGKFDSAVLLNRKSIDICLGLKNEIELGKAYSNLAAAYTNMDEADSALLYFEKAIVYLKKMDNPIVQSIVLDNMSILYLTVQQTEKAIEMSLEAKKVAVLEDNPFQYANILLNLGNAYDRSGNYKEATKCIDEAEPIIRKYNFRNLELSVNLNRMDILIKQTKYDKIEPYATRALALSRELKNRSSEVNSLRGMGYYYFYKKDFKKAEIYAQEAIKVSDETLQKMQKAYCLELLSNIYMATDRLEQASIYKNWSSLLQDTVTNERVRKQSVAIEKKYQLQLKQERIEQLTKNQKIQKLELSQKRNWNYTLIGILIVLVVIAGLYYKNFRQKQLLKDQKIAELEYEKKLNATEAVLQGETQERQRIAKDLHDGLGGMLSGIKHSLNSMKENMVLSAEWALRFERSIDMLNSSIQEMRRVAHNMMPENLLKFGLNAALNDYCKELNQSGKIAISYQSLGMENSPNNKNSVHVYRIVQELVNNILKHASAKTALVQLSLSGNCLSITVEDDGIGFDPTTLSNSSGIGMSNINNRIELLNGTIDIKSAPNEGSSFHIEIENYED
ncbi:MAG: sensor histidine kinase [Chitinophagaceae bacterium]|nr:sensor histidine kinase [Chitinophagaceae bacterium]